jgi:hypothetical protein
MPPLAKNVSVATDSFEFPRASISDLAGVGYTPGLTRATRPRRECN